MAFLPLLSICFPCNGNWYHYKKEVSSHSDNTIETRIRDPLVERLNRHRNELLKQNPIPRTFIGEPSVSQVNDLHKPR
ncbi:hypothetical protein [Wolbachia endosymbiont of Dactylopius coccus]